MALKWKAVLAAGAAWSIPAASLQAAVLYSVQDLGTGGGTSIEVTGLNNLGQAVGTTQRDDGRTFGFVCRNGSLTEIAPVAGYGAVLPQDINDAGLVVGIARGSAGQAAFTFTTTLSFLPSPFNTATGINAAGQIAGGAGEAAVFYNGQITRLGYAGGGAGYSMANDINDLGEVVGESDIASFERRATLYDATGAHDLSTLGGLSRAEAINNRGQVVGSSFTADGNAHAFLFNNGVMEDLGTMGGTRSFAADINDDGQIIGDFAGAASGAFLYSKGVAMNLNALIDPALGFDIIGAGAINDAGQIAAWTRDGHAVLLNPVLPVPEPNMWMLLIAGFGMTGTALRRGRVHPRSETYGRILP